MYWDWRYSRYDRWYHEARADLDAALGSRVALSVGARTTTVVETLCPRSGLFRLLLRPAVVGYATRQRSIHVAATFRYNRSRKHGDSKHSRTDGLRKSGGVCRSGDPSARNKPVFD